MVSVGSVGSFDPAAAESVRPDTLFDAASLTKPVATAVSLLFLLDRGEVVLSDPVARFMERAGRPWKNVTLLDLLTHTSGLPPYVEPDGPFSSRDSMLEGILALPLSSRPGERYVYSCLGYILVERIIETVTGETLDSFAGRTIFQPLGMANTTFRPGTALLPRVASGGYCPRRQKLVYGEPHDPLAWRAGGVSGNAGLFSCPTDLCRFGAAVLASAALAEDGPLSPAGARLMLSSQISPDVGGQTIGFFAHPNPMLPRGDLLPAKTVGHTGFTGTSLVLVPGLDLVVALMANSLVYTQDKTEFFRSRRRFHNLVAAAIVT